MVQRTKQSLQTLRSAFAPLSLSLSLDLLRKLLLTPQETDIGSTKMAWRQSKQEPDRMQKNEFILI